MNIYYLTYKFNKEVIESLDPKYLEKIDMKKDNLFLYANCLEIVKFYTMYHPFHHFRNINELFKNDPRLFFESFIIYIKKHSYNKYDISLLYSLASYFILFSNSNYQKISHFTDYKFFKKDLDSINYYTYFKEAHKYSAYTLDTLRNVISETYHIYNFDLIETLSLKKFYHYYNGNILTKLGFCLVKPFSKNYKSLDIKNGVEFKDIDFSFDKQNAIDLINILNDYLYFNNPDSFNKYFIDKKEIFK